MAAVVRIWEAATRSLPPLPPSPLSTPSLRGGQKHNAGNSTNGLHVSYSSIYILVKRKEKVHKLDERLGSSRIGVLLSFIASLFLAVSLSLSISLYSSSLLLLFLRARRGVAPPPPAPPHRQAAGPTCARRRGRRGRREQSRRTLEVPLTQWAERRSPKPLLDTDRAETVLAGEHPGDISVFKVCDANRTSLRRFLPRDRLTPSLRPSANFFSKRRP